MSENGKLVPKRRFKEFQNADAWEQRKLGQYTKLITKGTTPKDKTGIGDVNFVKVENITNGKIYPINKIKQHEHDNYLKRSRLEEKDILFSIAGTLGRTAIVSKSILPANTNQALAIIRGYDFDTNFLITSLAGHVVKEYIRRNPTVGAQPNLSLEQVGNLLVNTPNVEEQQKIGTFFKQLDDTIALHQRKLEKMKSMKSAYLSEMFPADGECKPKRRFPGFTDAWEQSELGELATMNARIGWQNLRTSEFLDSGDYMLITGTDFKDGEIDYSNIHYVEKKRYDQDKKIQIQNNSILITKDGTLGKVAYVERLAMPATLNAGVFNVKVKEGGINVDSKYLFHYLKAPFLLKYANAQSTGGTIKHLNQNVLVNFPIPLPAIDEQVKIGAFFKQLDDSIAFQQQKLEKLQNIKKAYLNEMFI